MTKVGVGDLKIMPSTGKQHESAKTFAVDMVGSGPVYRASSR